MRCHFVYLEPKSICQVRLGTFQARKREALVETREDVFSQRLETATKIYGVGLLVTDTFYALLSKERKRGMRTCDRVLCDKLGEVRNYASSLRNTPLFFNFSQVCPEPVLVK
jgi:hypothetical protein